MDSNYYPERGEFDTLYGACGIHDVTFKTEFDICPKCEKLDREYYKRLVQEWRKQEQNG